MVPRRLGQVITMPATLASLAPLLRHPIDHDLVSDHDKLETSPAAAQDGGQDQAGQAAAPGSAQTGQ